MTEPIVDFFAGRGEASLGIETALGRSPAAPAAKLKAQEAAETAQSDCIKISGARYPASGYLEVLDAQVEAFAAK